MRDDRRKFIRDASALGAVAVCRVTELFGFAPPEAGEQVIPFADTTPFNPEKPRLPWEQTTSWLTPTEQLFWVGHYGIPKPVTDWSLQISGLVEKPQKLTLADLKARPRREVTLTLECSGNGAAGGMVGNTKWAGTPLAPILKSCGIKRDAIEAVFFAVDQGTEKIRGGEYPQQFARSMAVSDAIADNILLAWELNGAPLNQEHGAPVRMVVPGWYGVAWVKWLNRIELHDRRFMNRFMGRDYVTIRGEKHGDETIWRETSVGRMNLKSVVGRVVRREDGTLRVSGAAWSDGTPIRSVELKIDDGEWKQVRLESKPNDRYTWQFWTYDWTDAKPGEHTLTSRATDAKGRVQPAPDDPFITMKKTYWEANQQAVRKLTV